MKSVGSDYVLFPKAIVVDTREQLPFSFAGIRADGGAWPPRDRGKTLIVECVAGTLASGDYSLAGAETRVAVERKSVADLFNTLGQGRERFVRELFRLNSYQFAAVVVEADWSTILHNPPPFSQLLPKTVMRSVIAWQMAFPRVHWNFLPDRRHAEIWTFRVLERFWREECKRKRLEDDLNKSAAR